MADEHMMGAEDDDVQFMRTVRFSNFYSKQQNFIESSLFVFVFQEDHLCLSCVPVSGVKRMALAGEVFGNRMCYLEDISNEVKTIRFDSNRSIARCFLFSLFLVVNVL